MNILEKLNKFCNNISKGLPAEIEARKKKQFVYYIDKFLKLKEFIKNLYFLLLKKKLKLNNIFNWS